MFLVKIALTLSHGQASVEHSSSLDKSVLNHNISEDSFVAKKAIKDHMLPNGLESQSVIISNELIRCVSGACQKYQDYLAQCKDEEKHLKLDQQNSILLKEMDKVTSKHDQLDKIHASLEADYVNVIEMVESKMDLSYVSKVNALKRKAVDVKNDIKKLEETFSMLQEKRKNYSLETLNFYSRKNLTKS